MAQVGNSGSQEGSTRQHYWLAIAVVLLATMSWKTLLLGLDLFPFNADEAIVGLMARHILKGEIPIFFYGQAYLGSLDALLVAALMSVFGSKVIIIRIVQVLLYMTTVLLVMLLVRRIYKTRISVWAAGLVMAFPTVNLTLYTTVSLGGYGEALLLGAALFLLLHKIESDGPSVALCALWGVLGGLGFWVFGLTLVFTLPALMALLLILRRQPSFGIHGVAIAAGFLVGASPWLVWAAASGTPALLQELFGSAIAGASQGGVLLAWAEHARNFLLFGPTVILGLRPPWGTQPLLPYLVPLPLVFWSAVAVYSWRRVAHQNASVTEFALIGSAGLVVLGFIVTPFGADPSGRYFLPMIIPMAVFAGGATRWFRYRSSPQVVVSALAALLLFQAVSTLQAAYRNPTGLTTQFDPVARIDFSSMQDLINFLENEGATRGYTNYWVAYPLAFRSEEQLIFVPELPYHQDFRYTDRDNRYRPYKRMVAESDEVAYITANHPALNVALHGSFQEQGVDFKVKELDPFTVFYDLTRPVRPEELNLPQPESQEP
ncbi:MAG: ArnT family glycosyltransferase [Anaerolineales bacterium]